MINMPTIKKITPIAICQLILAAGQMSQMEDKAKMAPTR
jgi:hypothetical protein